VQTHLKSIRQVCGARGGEVTASCFESVGGVGETGALDGCVAFEPHADETVVLGNDLIFWFGKVEGVSFFGSWTSWWGIITTEIMEFEFQVCGKLFFVTEDDPSETSIDETILVSRTWSQMD
jgi:hypothetical protein